MVSCIVGDNMVITKRKDQPYKDETITALDH